MRCSVRPELVEGYIILLFISFGFAQAADQHNKVLDRVSSLQKLAAKKILSSYKDPRECMQHLPPDATIEKYMVREILKPYKIFLTSVQSEEYKDQVRTFAYHPHGKSIAISSMVQDDAHNNAANHIIISDLKTKKTIASLDGHIGSISALAFNADGTQLASGGVEEIIRLWNCDQWKEYKQLAHTDEILMLCFNPQVKNQLASIGFEGTVTVWDIQTGEKVLQKMGDEIAYNASGTKLAIQRDGVSIYDTTTWQLLQKLESNNGFYALAYNVHDQLAMSGCYKVFIIDDRPAKSDDEIGFLKSGYFPSLTYNPKGDRLVVGGDGHVNTVVWDISSGHYVIIESPLLKKIAYHPHNKQFALLVPGDTLHIATLSSYKKTLEKLTIDQATCVFNMLHQKFAPSKEIPSLEQYKTYTTLPDTIKELVRRFTPAPVRPQM